MMCYPCNPLDSSLLKPICEKIERNLLEINRINMIYECFRSRRYAYGDFFGENESFPLPFAIADFSLK